MSRRWMMNGQFALYHSGEYNLDELVEALYKKGHRITAEYLSEETGETLDRCKKCLEDNKDLCPPKRAYPKLKDYLD